MARFLSSLNPINSFPDYHGPYNVGTIDVEIPAADLPSPSETVPGAQPTIAFRMFYPCIRDSEKERPVRWIPSPQKETMSAFAKFMGARDRYAWAFRWLPQHLYWTTIPAQRNAKLLDPPTSNSRWPVTFFSHGLAGSRNAYSYVCGDLASHGTVVIAMDHRDGSSPIQYVRATDTTEAAIVEPIKLSHQPSPEVYEGRDRQLRIRLWELGLAFEALAKIDAGEEVENLDDNTSRNRKERVEVLQRFRNVLDIHRPGKVSWAGHSFGSATTVQLLKSLFYQQDAPSNGKTLLTARPDSKILRQISPDSPALLLDMWCLPLRSPDQEWLWNRPLPTYAPGGPQGNNILSVLSEGFFKWKANRNDTSEVVAGPKASSINNTRSEANTKATPAWAGLRSDSPSCDSGYASETSHSSPSPLPMTTQPTTAGPHEFYPQHSQHFSQSDYGILFPWVMKRFAKVDDPERILLLNVRAMAQVMREAGVEVAGERDDQVLDAKSGAIKGWIPLSSADEGEEMRGKRKSSVKDVKDAAPRDGEGVGAALEA
ncbi:hypothetical protein MBLNU230_g7691t1 [Neophaeotheca triangularis]